jgi:hypothetical protein
MTVRLRLPHPCWIRCVPSSCLYVAGNGVCGVFEQRQDQPCASTLQDGKDAIRVEVIVVFHGVVGG